MAGVAVIGSAAVGAASKAWGASQASSAQGKAGRLAMMQQQKMYDQARQDFDPYLKLGKQGVDALSSSLSDLVAPIVMDQATLEATPGYQFTKRQGLKSVQNSAAARGLGSSGAAMKGAADYATGLADTTYKTQFDVARANKTDAFNRLASVVGMGSGATGALTSAGTQTGQGMASSQIGIGNAQAAGYNAMGQAVGTFANNVGGFAMSDQGKNWFKGLYQ